MSLSIKDYQGPKIPQYITGTLAAGLMRGIDAVGEKFYVVESDGILTIKTNVGTKNEFAQRQGEYANSDALYERIEIYNNTLNPINYKIFYGFGDFTDGRADIIGTVTIDAPVPLPVGASTEVTVAAILAKLIAAPATEAKQDTLISQIGVNAAASGFSRFRTVALTNAAQAVKAAAGKVVGIKIINPNAAPVYVKFCDLAAAGVVVGVAAVKDVYEIPANDGTNDGQLIIVPTQFALFDYAVAISVYAVTTLADAGAVAPATAVYCQIDYV